MKKVYSGGRIKMPGRRDAARYVIIKRSTAMIKTLLGLLIPFVGTAAGAACVFFMRKELSLNVQRALTGFAAGVMTAASIPPP